MSDYLPLPHPDVHVALTPEEIDEFIDQHSEEIRELAKKLDEDRQKQGE